MGIVLESRVQITLEMRAIVVSILMENFEELSWIILKETFLGLF